MLAEDGHGNAILYTEESPQTIRNGVWPSHHVDVAAELGTQVQRVLEMEQPDVAYIHHVSSPALIEYIGHRLPGVAYVHGFTAVCPGLGKYYRRGDAVCERPFGWGCVPLHYLRRCSAARHPRTLSRLMGNTSELQQALLKLPRFLVGSHYMADLLAQNGFPAEKITVLPPHFISDDDRPAYLPSTEPDCILYAGRLEVEKGFPYLLQALAALPGTGRLLVAGDGTQRAIYEAMAQELGVGGRVSFLGWLDEQTLNQVLRQCSLVAMPSIFPEPFGKVGIEALMQGRPVVASDVGGISDWLEDGVNGFLVRPADSQALAAKINQLLHDEALRTGMGKSGQNSVVRRYRASQHLEILLAALAAARDLGG